LNGQTQPQTPYLYLETPFLRHPSVYYSFPEGFFTKREIETNRFHSAKLSTFASGAEIRRPNALTPRSIIERTRRYQNKDKDYNPLKEMEHQ